MFGLRRLPRFSWLLAVLVFVPCWHANAAQVFGVAGAKARKGSAARPVPTSTPEAPKPQLLNSDSNPTLRYPVAVWESTVSCGWLDVTQSGISYTVVQSGQKSKPAFGKKFVGSAGGSHFAAPEAAAGDEGFAVNSSEITGTQLVKNFLQIKFGKRAPLLIYLAQDYWGAAAGKPRVFEEYAQSNPTGTMAVQRGVQNFAAVLAEVKPPALDLSLRAEPTSVERGHAVNLVWNSANATSLDLEPGVGRVPAAGTLAQSPQDSTTYTLSASGPAGAKAVSVYVTVTAPAGPPTLVLIEPSAAGDGQTVDVANSPLVVRGAVMDASGIPVVTVNGKSVTIRPTSAQAAEFKSDPIDLSPGETRLEVVAVNSAQRQSKVTFVARYTPPPPKPRPAEPTNPRGLEKAEIINLLQGNVPSEHVAELVKQRGIKFVPTPDDLKEIRAAGGGDDLIDAVSQAQGPAKN